MVKRRGGGPTAPRSTGKHVPGSGNKGAVSNGTQVRGAALRRAKQASNRRPVPRVQQPNDAVSVNVYVNIGLPKTLDARFAELARKAEMEQSRVQAPMVPTAHGYRPRALSKAQQAQYAPVTAAASSRQRRKAGGSQGKFPLQLARGGVQKSQMQRKGAKQQQRQGSKAAPASSARMSTPTRPKQGRRGPRGPGKGKKT